MAIENEGTGSSTPGQKKNTQGEVILPPEPTPSSGGVAVADGAPSGFHPQFNTGIEALIAAAPGAITVNSGFRDIAKQQQLWDDAVAKYGSAEAADDWVAPPGSSMHNWGFAADLKFDSEATRQWAHANASKFGSNFPLGNEPWHVEMADGDSRMTVDAARNYWSDGGSVPMSTSSGTAEEAGSVQAAGFSVPTVPGAANMGDDELRAVMRRDFGYLSWALDVPEVGDILLKMARGELAGDRAFAAIQATEWYQTTEASARQWDATANADPAEAQDQVNRRALDLRLQSSRLGLDITPQRLELLARDSLRFGWTDAELRQAMAAESSFDPDAGGAIGSGITDLKGIAEREYFVQMSRSTAAEWQRRIFLGEVDESGFREAMKNLSAMRFPAFADQIASGVSPSMLFDSYREMASSVLERDADSIDMLNDPKFSGALQVRDDKGQLRPMTLSEWQTHLRKQPEWRRTDNARKAAAGAASALGQVFGKV